MNVRIDENTRIIGDRLSFTVETRSVVKEGKNAGNEVWTAQGFYTNLHSAINALLKMKLSTSAATTLQELLQEVKEHRAFIEAKVQI